MYMKMFSKKRPSKEDLENWKGNDYVVPLMPSQQAVVKSLVWAFKILSGKLDGAGIGAEKMLETNQNQTNSTTRSQTKDLFDRSVGRKEYHNDKLSILRRHKGLIQEILGSEEYSEMLHMTIKQQKSSIEQFIRKQNTKQNKIREEIRQGNYVENTWLRDLGDFSEKFRASTPNEN